MSNLKMIIIVLSMLILMESYFGYSQTTSSTTINGGFNDSDTFLYVEPCIYFYAASIVATIYTKNSGSSYKSTEYTLPGTFTFDSASSCYNNTSYNYLQWTYNNSGDSSNPFSSFLLGLNVTQYTGSAWSWWKLEKIIGEVTLNQNWSSKPNQGWSSSTFNFNWYSYELDEEKNLEAPVNRSYHCADGVVFYGPNSTSLSSVDWTSTTSPPPMILNFTMLQMEFFRKTDFGTSFSMPLDCESLFTTGMLMAIFAVTILLAIVFFGVIMLMSIQTVDRFDDMRDEKYKAQMALMQQLHMKAE